MQNTTRTMYQDGMAWEVANACPLPAAQRQEHADEIRQMPHDDAELPRNTTRGQAAVASADYLNLHGIDRARFLRACGV